MRNFFNKLQFKFNAIPTWTLIVVPSILALISFWNFFTAFMLGWMFFFIPLLLLVILMTLTNREKKKRYLSMLLKCTVLLVIPCIFIAQPLIEQFKRLDPIYANQQDELANTAALQQEKRRLFIEQHPNNECSEQKKREAMEDNERAAANKATEENRFTKKLARGVVRTLTFESCIDQLINKEDDSVKNSK